jgi:hypothetical protein
LTSLSNREFAYVTRCLGQLKQVLSKKRQSQRHSLMYCVWRGIYLVVKGDAHSGVDLKLGVNSGTQHLSPVWQLRVTEAAEILLPAK